MKGKSNERGGALLMVLLLIIVFTVLGMGILATTINASKQFTKTEEKVQARLLAEMGIMHYQADLKQVIIDTNLENQHIENEPEEFETFCTMLTNLNIELTQDMAQPITGTYTISEVVVDCTREKITINFVSTGNAVGNSIAINALLTLLPSGGTGDGEQEPITYPKFDGTTTFYQPVIFTENNEVKKVQLTFKENATFEKDLTLDTAGGEQNAASVNADKNLFVGHNLTLNNHNEFNVGGELVVVGDLSTGNHSCIAVKNKIRTSGSITLGNHSILVIYGDAYFAKLPTGGHVYIEGKLFINDIETTNNYNVKPSSNDFSCKQSEDFADIVDPNPGWLPPDDFEFEYNG